MIADSPYSVRPLILGSTVGATVGGMAAMFMLITPFVFNPATPTSSMYLHALGTWAGATPWGDPAVFGAGALIHAGIGVLLGILYATSQRRAPTQALLACGLFYGFAVWLLGGMVASHWIAPGLYPTTRSVPWLFACLTYGATLGVAAIAFQNRLPAAGALPKD